jgi:Ca-activated chloride channel homolog
VTLLEPVALAALLVGPVIYLIHWLRSSRRKMRVPALFLWADLPRASTGRSRRRWPPLSLLLILQLLIAALVAVALARPATPTDPPRHLALILDASASMQATDVAPTRFDVARIRALDRLATLRQTDLVSLIRAGRNASLLANGSPEAARVALGAMQPGTGTGAIREALALASTQVARTPERRGAIVLVTDAAFPAPDPIGVLAAPVEVVPVGGGGENQAITSLQVRMDSTARGQTAFVEIANQADHVVRVPTRLTADGAPLDERQVDVAARSRTRLSIPLPVDVRHISMRLLGRDALALDDMLETTAPGGPPRDVVLLGRGSEGLRRALESIPFLRVRNTTPGGADQPRADLTVLEGTLPAQLPAGPLLLVDPPANSARLLGVGLGSGARVQQAHPLLQGLDLVALQNETPSVGGVPGWATVVLGTLKGPLIMEGRLEGHPTLALTFSPYVSGLEKSLAFPLLISNATAFLLTQSESTARLAPVEPFDTAESDITPRQLPTFAAASATQAGSASAASSTSGGSSASSALSTSAASGVGLLEVWPWLVASALVLLGAEWLVFARRG